jgi:hypothetical protein
MYKITARTPVTGVGYGIPFVEGVAHTEDEALARKLERKGYVVELLEEATPALQQLATGQEGIGEPPANGQDGAGEPPANGQDGAGEPPADGQDDTGEPPADGQDGAGELLALADVQVPNFTGKGRAEIDAFGATIGIDTKKATDKKAAIAMIMDAINQAKSTA